MFSNFFLIMHFMIKWKKYCKAGQSIVRIWCKCIAHWIPKLTNTELEIYNTYCFSTATTVA